MSDKFLTRMNKEIQDSLLNRGDLNFLGLQKAEDDFLKLYEFNKALVNTIPYGIGVVDEDGNLLYVSRQLKNLIEQDGVGKKCWDTFRDKRLPCTECPLNKNIKVGETKMIETSEVFGGRIFQVTITGMKLEGKKVLLEVYHDITELKRSQEQAWFLAEELRAEKRKLEKVLSIDLGMRTICKLNDLVDFIVEKSTEVLEAEKCSLMLLDPGARELVIRGAKGIEDHVIKESRVPLGEWISGMVAEESCPILIEDIESNVRFTRQNRPNYRTRSFMSAPIKVHNKVIGVVNIADKTSDHSNVFTESDLNILCTIVHLAAVAIENADFVRQLTHLSMTDPLTGIYNHRYFIGSLEREIHRRKRYNKPLCLFMIDIDDFKIYNDTYGHLEGDRLLKTFAGILKDNLRVVDVVCRYAGDEFVVILPETDSTDALKVAHKIKKAIESTVLKQKVTISIGLAKSVPTMNRYDLILKADTALYQAKKQGKNSICCLD